MTKNFWENKEQKKDIHYMKLPGTHKYRVNLDDLLLFRTWKQWPCLLLYILLAIFSFLSHIGNLNKAVLLEENLALPTFSHLCVVPHYSYSLPIKQVATFSPKSGKGHFLWEIFLDHQLPTLRTAPFLLALLLQPFTILFTWIHSFNRYVLGTQHTAGPGVGFWRNCLFH